MSAIGKGDWIEALDDQPPFYHRGSVWFVEAAWSAEGCTSSDDCEGIALILSGMRMPAGVEAACSCGFRPLGGFKSNLTEQLKQPAPDAVRELEDA